MKKNKKMIAITCAVIALIVVFGVIVVRRQLERNVQEGKDSYDLRIDVLNESYPTDIILFGEPIPFREKLIYRTVSQITNETFQTEKEHQVIILSDLDGTMNISDAELHLIKERVFSYQCSFYYLGTKLQDKLLELGFIEKAWPEGDYCVALVPTNGRIIYSYDNWTEKDKQQTDDSREMVGNLIIIDIVHFLEEYQ